MTASAGAAGRGVLVLAATPIGDLYALGVIAYETAALTPRAA